MSQKHQPDAAPTRRERTAVRGAFAGFFIDNFDIYLPVIVMAPAMPYFLPDSMDSSTKAVVTSWVFVATLIGRPIGSTIFGILADTIGRRRSTTIAAAGFSVTTLAIGLLPGYHTLGITAVILLVALRFIDGIFLGGEYSGANTLAMEESKPSRRGLNGGLIQSGATVAFVVASLLVIVLLQVAPAGDEHSAYATWGWRIPFFVGAALSLGFMLYYRNEVQESTTWSSDHRSKRKSNPLAALFRGTNRRSIIQVFVLMTGLWFLLNSITAILPNHIRNDVGFSSTTTTWLLVVLYSVLTGVFIGGGIVSQRIGRRRYLMITATLGICAGVPAYLTISNGVPEGFVATAVVTCITGSAIIAPWAVVTPYITERFTTEARATGFGLGYSLAVVIPGFYATYQLWLENLVPEAFTAPILVLIGCTLVIVGAALGPESSAAAFDEQPGEQPADTRHDRVESA